MLKPEQIDELKKPLDWSRVKERKGPRGRMLSYLEGYDMIDRANKIFGYGNWGYDILNVELVPTANRNGEITGAYYTARVRLTIRDSMPITEEGLVALEEGQGGDPIPLHDTARKGAITDALKRALRCYGEQFGNSLYDKDEIAERKAEAQQGNQSKFVPRPGVDWQAFKDRYSAATTMRGIETIDNELKALNLPASGEKTALWKHREACAARIQQVTAAERTGK